MNIDLDQLLAEIFPDTPTKDNKPNPSPVPEDDPASHPDDDILGDLFGELVQSEVTT